MSWADLERYGRPYLHPKGILHDVVRYRDGVGFICREGHFGFHAAHPDPNWLEIRSTERGRLFAIVENALDALNLAALNPFWA